MSAPDGCYPRLNAALCLSGRYEGALVSVVGTHLQGATTAPDGGRQFRCSDDGLIGLNTDHLEPPPGGFDAATGPVELVGQWMQGKLVVFVTRELSKDTDLAVYEKMLQVQQLPKYRHYFDHAVSAPAH